MIKSSDIQGYNSDESDDFNFMPLHIEPLLAPKRPDFVPPLDINKVLIIKNRR